MFVIALAATASMLVADDATRFTALAPEVENAQSAFAGWGYDSRRGSWHRTDVYAYRSADGDWIALLRREQSDHTAPMWADAASCPAVLEVVDAFRGLSVDFRLDLPGQRVETSDPGARYIWGKAGEGFDYVRVSAGSELGRSFISAAERQLADCWKGERPL